MNDIWYKTEGSKYYVNRVRVRRIGREEIYEAGTCEARAFERSMFEAVE